MLSICRRFPGVILGGTDVSFDEAESGGSAFGKTNVIAQTVVVDGGLRFISGEQEERAREAMRRVVERHLPRTSAEISFEDGYPAMPPADGNLELLGLLLELLLLLLLLLLYLYAIYQVLIQGAKCPPLIVE